MVEHGRDREPTPENLERAVRGRRRREPRYPLFLATGAAAGVLVAAVIALLVVSPQTYSRATVFGYLAVSLGLLGTLLGGLAAVLASDALASGSGDVADERS